MPKKTLFARGFLLLVFLLCMIPFRKGNAQDPVVRAVLFYSPSCPHCHLVMTEYLPPLVQEYGDRLQILAVNTYTEGGLILFQAVVDTFKLEYAGVPLLVVADQVLIGSGEIPERFPILVEQYMAAGGVDWPDIPGLADAIAALPTQPPSATAEPAATETAGETPDNNANIPTPSPEPSVQPISPTATESAPIAPASEPTLPAGLIAIENSNPGLAARLQYDLAGNILAITVLVGMILLIIFSLPSFMRSFWSSETAARTWLFGLLALIGLSIAGYLAWIETQQLEAVCGPIGDCNTVQQSSYASLFNVLPMGVLGVIGYCGILAAWLAARYSANSLGQWALIALRGMTFFGTLFSVYLTFLEPFMIGATCAWCLSSAVIMTALYWMTIQPRERTAREIRLTPR